METCKPKNITLYNDVKITEDKLLGKEISFLHKNDGFIKNIKGEVVKITFTNKTCHLFVKDINEKLNNLITIEEDNESGTSISIPYAYEVCSIYARL